MVDISLPIDVPVMPLSEDFYFIMLICLLTGSLTDLRCKDTIQSKHLVRAVISAEFMSVWSTSVPYPGKRASRIFFSLRERMASCCTDLPGLSTEVYALNHL